MSRIRVMIGELVLKGFHPSTRNAVAQGLRQELSRILADPASRAEWAHSHSAPILRLGSIPLEPGVAGARKFGAGIAKGVGKGLKR
jgi:hypothetical protein